MAEFLVLSDYPDIADRKRDLGDNHGRYFKHLMFAQRAPWGDVAIEFLYDSFQDMIAGNNKWRSIEARHKPKVVIALGGSTLRTFNIEGKINEVRGSVFKVDRRTRDMFVIPTFHPRDLKNPIRMFDDEPIEKGYCTAGDITRAVHVYKYGWDVPKERFNIDPTVEEVEKFVEDAITNKWLLGTDLEATGLNLDIVDIVMAGFAWTESDAIVIPFRKEGGGQYYSAEDWERVKTALNRLFQEGQFMFQNGVGYDIPLLRKRGWNFPLENFKVDTMVMHHTLSPELPHKIGFISSQYGKQPYWKDAFVGHKVHIYEMDQEVVKTYNARDCVALHQIYNGMARHIDELIALDEKVYGRLWQVFWDAMELSRAVMITEEQGILIDDKKVTIWRKYLDGEIAKIESELNRLATLPPTFNLGSGDDVRYWLYHEKPMKLQRGYKNELAKYDFPKFNYQYHCPYCGRKRSKGYQPDLETVPEKLVVDCPKCNAQIPMVRTSQAPTPIKGKNKGTDAYNKLIALKELDELTLLPKLRGYIPQTTEADNSAINKGAITRYIIHIDKRLDFLENEIKRKTEAHEKEEKDLKYTKSVLIILQKYGKIKKLQESFYEFKKCPNGKVYPHLLVTGTATGRFSCKDPNLQQLPSGEVGEKDSGENLIRDCFRAEPGYELMSVDFSNLEVVIGAYFMLDQALIEVVESGLNFHDVNNKIFFNITEDDPTWKTLRKVAKMIVFARLLYGGSDSGIYAKVMTAFPDCGLTLKRFKEAVQNYMDAHPDYVKFCKEVIELAETRRISVNAFGRVRTLLGRKDQLPRQALNTPIQGSAADAVRQDYVLLNRAFLEANLKCRIVLQVHDEFLFHYPVEERAEVVRIAKSIMGREREINGRKFHIGIDAEVGTHWGSLNALNLETLEVAKGSKH